MEQKKFYKLMEPIKIGGMNVKNRIVFPPMNTNLTSENGYVTPQLEEYYVRRAKGGAGLIVLEATSVSANSKNHPRQPILCDRRHTASWARLVEKLHRYQAMVSIELVHYGSEAAMLPRVSPSGISKFKEEPGEILTIEGIHKIQHQFIVAATLAKQAGIDAITLHACHGYLIAEFLSAVFNHRTDEYGGTFDNRCRFLLEIIQRCRIELGSRFPIIVRYSAEEFVAGGRGMEESVKLAKVLEEHGVDAIDISASQPSAYLMTTPPYCLPQAKGLLVPYSEAIKKAVNIPVFTAICIRDPEFAEKILEDKQADLVALGRSQIADPDYANKVKYNETKSIRHCLSCEYCLDTLDDDRQICCAINPEAGRETEFQDVRESKVKKKVVIIGSGPAGMEAARMANMRGHSTILYERYSELGGTLTAAKLPPNKEMIGRLVDWYVAQLEEGQVSIYRSEEATEELIDQLNPDILVLACGSHYIKRIAGSDLSHVLNAYEALKNPEKVGKNIVIVGGGASGAEVAEFFAGATTEITCLGVEELGGEIQYSAKKIKEDSGKHIVVVEMLDSICSDMDIFCKDTMLYTLEQNGVRLCPSHRVEEITDHYVHIHNLKSGKNEALPVDTVILAGGLASNMQGQFIDKDYSIIRIGDAIKPGKIKDAIYTAYVQMINI